jgi:uncharacterized metal-binding protein
MALEKEATLKLKSLLEMSLEQFGWLRERWDELLLSDKYPIKIGPDFFAGYVFGKMEHKFIDWFYSTHGRSLTDDEYQEFYNLIIQFIASETKPD